MPLSPNLIQTAAAVALAATMHVALAAYLTAPTRDRQAMETGQSWTQPALQVALRTVSGDRGAAEPSRESAAPAQVTRNIEPAAPSTEVPELQSEARPKPEPTIERRPRGQQEKPVVPQDATLPAQLSQRADFEETEKPTPPSVLQPQKVTRQETHTQKVTSTKPSSTPMDPGRNDRHDGAGQSGADSSREAPAAFASALMRRLAEKKRYPLKARLARIEGTVRVTFAIDGQGRLLDLTIAASSGSALLDRAVQRMFDRCFPLPRHIASLAEGRAHRFNLPIHFSLHNQ